MKNLVIYSLLFILISCSQNKTNTPAETVRTVVESFYYGDKATLKKYTTKEGFSNLSSIQDMFTIDKNTELNFKILKKSIEEKDVWIQYSTSQDPIPGVFKLVLEEGQWKVTHNGPRDKGPF